MTVKQTVEITNKLGMHARPAMKLFELMQGFDAEVLLRNDEGTEAEANSVIALLMLDSAKGRQIEVEATGPQEEEALAAVIALFNSGLMKINLHHFDIQIPSSSPAIRKARTEIVINQHQLYISCAFLLSEEP